MLAMQGQQHVQPRLQTFSTYPQLNAYTRMPTSVKLARWLVATAERYWQERFVVWVG